MRTTGALTTANLRVRRTRVERVERTASISSSTGRGRQSLAGCLLRVILAGGPTCVQAMLLRKFRTL